MSRIFLGLECINFITYLCCGDTVDEAGLLESFVAKGNGDLPAIAGIIINKFKGGSGFIILVLDVEVDIIFEIFHLCTKERLIKGVQNS